MAPSTLLAAFLAATVDAHGTITTPAMRANPHVNNGWCPYCQGSQVACDDDTIQNDQDCLPPAPCWGAPGPDTVLSAKFITLFNKKHPDGSFWIDQLGGFEAPPLYCPGDVVPIRYYIHYDHNGVFFWESQLASPGKEQEGKFVRISNHTSVNNYVKDGKQLANYFAAEDGVTEIKAGSCKDGSEWSRSVDRCMSNMFADTTLTLPADMPAGKTVLRWRWYGAMDESGKFVPGSKAERSLFVSCKDVVVGTSAQCAARSREVAV